MSYEPANGSLLGAPMVSNAVIFCGQHNNTLDSDPCLYIHSQIISLDSLLFYGWF